MKKNNRLVGSQGEELALNYLSGIGYRLLKRNYRCRFGEVDLIMADGSVTVFIEVKTRRSLIFGAPQEAVVPAKQARLKRIAEYYMVTNGIHEAHLRFDVVGISFSPQGVPKIEHLIGVF